MVGWLAVDLAVGQRLPNSLNALIDNSGVVVRGKAERGGPVGAFQAPEVATTPGVHQGMHAGEASSEAVQLLSYRLR